MGDYDVVKAVLGRIADMQWMQVAIKPAKPFAFGTAAARRWRGVPVFGLPGNPVSSLVSFEMFARPALRRMMGHQPGRPGSLWCPGPDGRAASGYGRQRGYTEVYRGAEYNVDLLPKIRVEVLATDEQADDILDVIIASSNTGRAGDGKVWTMDVFEAVRVRTGERGVAAI